MYVVSIAVVTVLERGGRGRLQGLRDPSLLCPQPRLRSAPSCSSSPRGHGRPWRRPVRRRSPEPGGSFIARACDRFAIVISPRTRRLAGDAPEDAGEAGAWRLAEKGAQCRALSLMRPSRERGTQDSNLESPVDRPSALRARARTPRPGSGPRSTQPSCFRRPLSGSSSFPDRRRSCLPRGGIPIYSLLAAG